MVKGRGLFRSELVVVEGQTEEAYIQDMWRGDLGKHVRRPVNAEGGSRIVPALRRRDLNDYTRVWIVMDAEKHPHADLQRVTKWVAGRSDSGKFTIIVTAPKVEAWLLAHYERPLGSGAGIERRLAQVTGYEKGSIPAGFPRGAWVEAESRIGMLPANPEILADASSCALCVPGSAMPLLVRELIGEG